MTDGQDMVVQFMIPARLKKDDKLIGEVFIESFLKVAKEKGIDHALKSFEESTLSWEDSAKLGEKGMIIRESSNHPWVPFGPAIRGKYGDCGNIDLSPDQENLDRVKLLENLLFGIPFESIMNLAQDDRWYTLGMGKYADSDDSYWKLKGVDKSLPDPAITLCRYLNITFFHASVYDELVDPDFDASDGVVKSKYTNQWKDEYMKRNLGGMEVLIESLPESFNGNLSVEENLELKWKFREAANDISIFRAMFSNELSIIYQACIAREKPDLEWFKETLNLLYSLLGLNINLEPSNYGGQETSWKGWERINSKLDHAIDNWRRENLEEYEEEGDEE
jgi:hypothetical protein